MASKSKPSKKPTTNSTNVTMATKLYDLLDSDIQRHVIMMILLTVTLILSTVMMVLILVSVASFRNISFS